MGYFGTERESWTINRVGRKEREREAEEREEREEG